MAFNAIPAEIALVVRLVTLFFWIHAILLPLDSDVFLASLSQLFRHDWASLTFGLWGFRKNETSSFCSWIWWFSPTFSVSADIDIRPCSVVKRPKGHSHLKLLQPPHIGCEFNRWHDCWSFGCSGKCLWNGERRGRHESKPRRTHANQVVGRGEAPSPCSRVHVSSRLDELPPAIFFSTMETIREIC